MPEPVDHSWPAAMPMPMPMPMPMVMVMPVGVTWAGLRIAHEAQDARRIRLQHVNNNHPGAVAKDSQNSKLKRCHAPAESYRWCVRLARGAAGPAG